MGRAEIRKYGSFARKASVPSAGQYLLAFDPDDPEAVLGIALFLAEKSIQGFWAAPLFPVKWAPGTKLNLVGPLGHGFDLPHNLQRLGLVALGETVSRLMPLVHLATQSHTGMTLFTDLSLPKLPAALEVYPLASLKESMDWPDFLALEVPLENLPQMSDTLGISSRDCSTLPGTGAGNNPHAVRRGGTVWGMCRTRQERLETCV